MIQTPEAPQHSEELRDALNSFSDWQNRPLHRVQCFTWSLAQKLEPSARAYACGLRIKAAYRHLYPGVQAWRNATAAKLKEMRKVGKITLPTYDERTGKWIEAPALRFVTRAEAVSAGFNVGRITKNPNSLHTISQQLRNEGYSEIIIAKDLKPASGRIFIFYVKHPAINP